MSSSLWPHGLQHTRLPCSSLSPGACSNSCALIWWYHPTISSSIFPLFSCLQSFPESGSFPKSWLFVSGGQSIGASASVSVLLTNIQDWCPLGLTGLISLEPKDSQESSTALQSEGINPSGSAFLIVQLSHPYMTTGKTIALTIQTFVCKIMSPLFNTLRRFVIAFLPRSKCLLISRLHSN